jgi:hypothetical protein
MIAALSTGSCFSAVVTSIRTVSTLGTVIRLGSTVGKVASGATERLISPHLTA